MRICSQRIDPFMSIRLILLLLLMCNSSVVGFAAKKKNAKGKPTRSGTTSIGFGLPPPSLEEVLAKFPCRLPPNPEMVDCPCGSSKTYTDCCFPLHNGSKECHSMIDVLRSRYSAFYLRNIGHIIATTHPTNGDYRDDKVEWAKDLNREGMFDSFEFVKLEVEQEHVGSNENEGYLEFKVTMRGRDEKDILRNGARRSAATVSGLETTIKERSRFLRDEESGTWLYASGDVTSEAVGLQDTKLNI